jgi:hypothetical protein
MRRWIDWRRGGGAWSAYQSDDRLCLCTPSGQAGVISLKSSEIARDDLWTFLLERYVHDHISVFLFFFPDI